MPRRAHSNAGELNRALNVALAHGDLQMALGAAKDLPAVDLAHAARILHLMAREHSPAFDRAAARWMARFAVEVKGVTAEQLAVAADAISSLPNLEAAETLLAAVKGTSYRTSFQSSS